MDAHLFVDVAYVRADSAFRDAKLLGDEGHAASFGEQKKDVLLALGKAVVGGDMLKLAPNFSVSFGAHSHFVGHWPNEHG